MTPTVTTTATEATNAEAAHTSSDDRALTIALPKGRTIGPVAKIFTSAGMEGQSDSGNASVIPLSQVLDEKTNRALIRRARFAGGLIHLLLLKPDDVPTYVEYGTADLGVCGRDVLAERDLDAYHPIDLGIGRCRLVVAGRVGDGLPTTPSGTRMPRIATKYPRLAAHHFARRGMQVEIVNVQSSVELAPLTGLADFIVDLVETGTTLKENGLEVKEEILAISTLLVANRASYKLRSGMIGPLLQSLRSVIR